MSLVTLKGMSVDPSGESSFHRGLVLSPQGRGESMRIAFTHSVRTETRDSSRILLFFFPQEIEEEKGRFVLFFFLNVRVIWKKPGLCEKEQIHILVAKSKERLSYSG